MINELLVSDFDCTQAEPQSRAPFVLLHLLARLESNRRRERRGNSRPSAPRLLISFAFSFWEGRKKPKRRKKIFRGASAPTGRSEICLMSFSRRNLFRGRKTFFRRNDSRFCFISHFHPNGRRGVGGLSTNFLHYAISSDYDGTTLISFLAPFSSAEAVNLRHYLRPCGSFTRARATSSCKKWNYKIVMPTRLWP